MIGFLAFAAAAALTSPTASPGPARSAGFQPITQATARATVQIRIISGAKFGPSHLAEPSGGMRRTARLADYDGQVSSAELLEFQ